MKYIAFILLICSSITVHSKTNLDSLYSELDKALELKSTYEKEKLDFINNLKNAFYNSDNDINNKLSLCNELIAAYQPYNFDSTLAYTERYISLAKKKDDSLILIKGNLKYVYVLAFSGRYTEALDILNNINYNTLPKELKIDYLIIKEQIYSDLFVQATLPEMSTKYYNLVNSFNDTLLSYLNENSNTYLQIKEKRYRDSRKLDKCKDINDRRFAMAKMGTRNYSTVAFERSLIYQLQNQNDLEKKFLILSAISDIKAAVKDNASLTRLALLLYKDGQIDKAYRYIKISFDDANSFNSRIRYIHISGVLPLITSAYQAKSNSQKKTLRNFLILISFLAILLVIALIAIRKQVIKYSKAQKKLENVNNVLKKVNSDLRQTNDKLRELNKDYQEASQLKEHYIGSFLSICSDYINKLENYRKMVNKSIRDKKITELFNKTKSGQLLEDELKEFYQNFDSIFLNIFPNFVEQFNALLIEENQINLNDPNKLNTELRIFALIRLGITDSSKIASLLRYSVNTIYNYRVKMRNAAKVPRDEFKNYVMRIDVGE